MGALCSTRLPYQDPYILVSLSGFEKVKTGVMKKFVFSRQFLGRLRPKPKSIWFGLNNGPSSMYLERELVSWTPKQDTIEAEWK
jgi:hypothetical protein